jgi:uncharacterized membrane protein
VWLSDVESATLSRVDRPTLGVFALAAALFVGFATYTSLLYEGFLLSGADFGSYVHMFSTTVQGEGFLIHGKYRLSHPRGSYWGGHFTLTLLLFLPLYALVPSPLTLLVAKSFVLAASVPMLWFIARSHIDSDRIAGFVVASYALNPFLWSAWVFDFQEQVLLPVFVFGAYYAFFRCWYRRFLLLTALALLTNEFVTLIFSGALVGLAVGAYREDRLDAEGPFIAAGMAMAVAVHFLAGFVISQFSRYGGIPKASVADPLHPFIEGSRVTVSALVGLIVADPSLLVDLLTIEIFDKFAFFVLLLVPMLFLAIRDEVALGALAPFLAFAWLFAGRSIYYVYGAHYPLYLLPFMYIGTVRVLGRVSLPHPSRELLSRLFVVVLVLNIGGSVSAAIDRQVIPETTEHMETLEVAIERIPDDASLVTQNDIYPHVATRPNTHYIVRPDLFERYQKRYGRVSPEYILIDTKLGTGVDWSEHIRKAFEDRIGDVYGAYRYEDGIWIFKRGYDGPTMAITSNVTVNPPVLPPPTPAQPGEGDSATPLDPRLDGDALDAAASGAGTSPTDATARRQTLAAPSAVSSAGPSTEPSAAPRETVASIRGVAPETPAHRDSTSISTHGVPT